MALILRVDVDKPYGNASFLKRVFSKFSEDYINFNCKHLGYLTHLEEFILFCNKQNIPGYFYHRLCTLPTENILKLYKEGGHKIGLHAENTQEYDTFLNELQILEEKTGQKIESFTKHGSGELKLGKHHYPPYEPEKYKEWTVTTDCSFYFGNGIANSPISLLPQNNYFQNMFWVEPDYRHKNLKDISDLIKIAKKQDVPVLIHPCNFSGSKIVHNAFIQIIKMAEQENIKWISPF